MKFLNRLRGRGRYHSERGDHWFVLAIIVFVIGLLAVVKLY